MAVCKECGSWQPASNVSMLLKTCFVRKASWGKWPCFSALCFWNRSFITLGSLWKRITYWSNENFLKLCCSSPELYHCELPSSLAWELWGSKWLHSLAIKLVFLIKDAECSARVHPLHSHRAELPCFRLSSIYTTFYLWIKLLNNDCNLHISLWLRACSTILTFKSCSCLFCTLTAVDIAWRVNFLIPQRPLFLLTLFSMVIF